MNLVATDLAANAETPKCYLPLPGVEDAPLSIRSEEVLAGATGERGSTYRLAMERVCCVRQTKARADDRLHSASSRTRPDDELKVDARISRCGDPE